MTRRAARTARTPSPTAGGRLCVEAKVPAIRLHDGRHTCGTLMHMQGVPIVVIAQWLGHADPAFTMRTFVHSQTMH